MQVKGGGTQKSLKLPNYKDQKDLIIPRLQMKKERVKWFKYTQKSAFCFGYSWSSCSIIFLIDYLFYFIFTSKLSVSETSFRPVPTRQKQIFRK